MATIAHDHRLARRAAPWLLGALLTTCLTRSFFSYGPGEMHVVILDNGRKETFVSPHFVPKIMANAVSGQVTGRRERVGE